MSTEIIGRGWSFPPVINSRGVLSLTTDRNEIEQAIHIILSTSLGQRVMRPNFGCRLFELVFAPNNSQTAAQARRYVEEALGMWEPRIQVQQVNIHQRSDQQNTLLIEIAYEIKGTHDRRSLVYPFYLETPENS